MTETERVEKLDGDGVRDWLAARAGSGLSVFRYRANAPGMVFLGVLAVAAVAGIAVLALRPGPMIPIQWLACLILGVFAGWCALSIFRWGMFALLSYVALSDDALLVGRGRSATVFPAARLDRSTIAVDQMRRGSRIELPIELDGVAVRVHLVGPFALLTELNQFIADVLARIAHNEGDEDSGDDAAAAGPVDGAASTDARGQSAAAGVDP
jgi:hypothetical protein